MSSAQDQKPTLDKSALEKILRQMTGQNLPLPDTAGVLAKVADSISKGQTLGYSQFNELLLNVGYDRVCRQFFVYLCDPAAVRVNGVGSDEIASADALEKGVNSFRELALLLYGNIKYGFKILSRDANRLGIFIEKARQQSSDVHFRSRHEPLVPLRTIGKKDAHLLGYISGREIESALKESPFDADLIKKRDHRDSVIEHGRWNHNVYLTYDHLDVYVATSMRERHEYAFVHDFMQKIESHPHIRDLRVRFFDPTRSFCIDRIDKGLAEALMLKRADCTIYLAQESDTLGKDSELASTLAQGKPVIAFVPRMSSRLWNYLLDTFKDIYPNERDEDLLLRLIKIYNVEAAWVNTEIREHLSGRAILETSALVEHARTAVEAHYNKRAKILKEDHPLGLQTNLKTGVANGVLVVRTISDCARLLRRILLNKLVFSIQEKDDHVLLNEEITGCTYRVMTGDKLLTNSFWNFYGAS